MHINIFTEYSFWFIIIIFLFAFLSAWFLYHNSKKLAEIGNKKLFLLATLRFLTVFIISFFILSPVLKYIKFKLEKPKIILVQDNSESIKLAHNQGYKSSKDYLNLLYSFINNTKEEFDLLTYTFGDKFSENFDLKFDEKETNFNKIFEAVQSKFVNYNIGALIIASDGIFNSGDNPLYSVKNLNFPVYTIALGDTSKKKDIILKNVYSNKIAFLGDFFPIEINVNANDFKNSEAVLKIENEGKTVYTETFFINENEFSKLFNINLEAKEKGLQRYKVSVSPLKSEFNKANNYGNVVVEVIDDKTKILILANSVHPDITAIKQALRFDKNYEIDFFTIDDFYKNVSDYQLIILHQLPSAVFNIQNLIKEIKNKQIPILFILGTQTNVKNFNLLKTDLQIVNNNSNMEDVNPYFNSNFKLFEVDENFAELFKNVPPLYSPFGDYNVSNYSENLFFQKILGVKTEKPLVFFINNLTNENTKYGFICGEGIWKWRMNIFVKNKNYKAFDGLITKIVHYLSINIKKDRLMVFSNNIYKENEDIILKADFYNESYELFNNPDLKLQITNSENKKFNFEFLKSQNSYYINLGSLEAGKYYYKVNTEFENKNYFKESGFTVLKVNIESINLMANHNLLFQIANENGGKMFYSNNLNQLFQDLKTNENIVTISHSTTNLQDLINFKWLFFIIIVFISAEWFLRKYFGSY
ncbi:MAG: hypothetical protein JXR51_06555 [Bacteroidales bacterium]|nr:hypothetical protein [Bacteroidales bacterium]MBN2756823.1 hypothetical protein [Bacteroidales bacterium]